MQGAESVQDEPQRHREEKRREEKRREEREDRKRLDSALATSPRRARILFSIANRTSTSGLRKRGIRGRERRPDGGNFLVAASPRRALASVNDGASRAIPGL